MSLYASHKSLEQVKQYYGKVLQSSEDLKTTACCAIESLPPHLAAINAQIHEEVRAKFFGCGITIPPLLDGMRVLDLGSGSGRDVYLLSRLVGEQGQVIGVDMTEQQLEVAERHKEYHRQAFGFKASNVTFRQGYIEDLEGAGIESESVDVVVSNCVVNLSPAKDRVLSEVLRVLKPGGELYFSDVYADRRLPESVQNDPVLLGECLGGALYVEDFRRLMLSLGIGDIRVVSQSPISVTSSELKQRLGNANFASITYRIFKMNLEDRCEDYGQVATYKGTIATHPHLFSLDDHHHFETGRPMLVCRNTASMLAGSRYAGHFEVSPPSETHFGLFDCSSGSAFAGDTRPANEAAGGACC